jgi:hypothetical protein
MASLVADRVDRPPTLFDFVEGTPAAPANNPERDAVAAPERKHEHEVGAAAGGAAHVHDGVGGEFTLDDMVVGAWEGLTAQAAVACPLCEGTLRPLYAGGGGADPVIAGRCDRCGTTLS